MRSIEVPTHGDVSGVELVDAEVPEPGPGQVLIDVEAVGVNYSDVMAVHGDYYGSPEPPYVPGTEVSGRISDVGKGVEMEEGKRVAALVSMDDGGYAEYTVAHSGVVLDIPESMSFEEAAGFPVQFTTAHCALSEWGRLESDERVLIHAAAGGVGTAAVQIADDIGAEIFATASTDEKLELASDLGADHCINYTTTDFEAEVLDRTDGEGVDVVLDGVGGAVFESSLTALAPFGRLVTFGAASGDSSTIDNRDVFFENRSVLGFHMGHALEHEPKRVFSAISRLTELFAEGSIQVQINETFPLEEATRALEHVQNRNSTGKVVLRT
jgi:NADPH2:quinone reductase